MSKDMHGVSSGMAVVSLIAASVMGTLPSDAETRTMQLSAYLRPSPTITAAPIDELQKGAIVEAGVCADGWCRVVAASGAGYVNAIALTPAAGAPASATTCWLGRSTGYIAANQTSYCAGSAATK